MCREEPPPCSPTHPHRFCCVVRLGVATFRGQVAGSRAKLLGEVEVASFLKKARSLCEVGWKGGTSIGVIVNILFRFVSRFLEGRHALHPHVICIFLCGAKFTPFASHIRSWRASGSLGTQQRESHRWPPHSTLQSKCSLALPVLRFVLNVTAPPISSLPKFWSFHVCGNKSERFSTFLEFNSRFRIDFCRRWTE